MSINPGDLLQYKLEHYGKYFPKCPKKLFSEDYCWFLGATSEGMALKHFQEERWQGSAPGWMPIGLQSAPKDKEAKKYVLFYVSSVDVFQRGLRSIKSQYIYCLVTHSSGDISQGWVRPEWVEPLVEDDYSSIAGKRAWEVYKEMQAKKKEA